MIIYEQKGDDLMEDTICAISTASGIGAMSIVRVSGINAIDIVFVGLFITARQPS